MKRSAQELQAASQALAQSLHSQGQAQAGSSAGVRDGEVVDAEPVETPGKP
jgi:hypothetical protein